MDDIFDTKEKGDKFFWGDKYVAGDTDWDFSDSTSKEAQLHIHLQAMQVSRLSLMNWILKRDDENKRKWLKKAAEDIADAKKTSVEAAQQALEADIKIVMENSGMDWEWSSDYALKKNVEKIKTATTLILN